MKILIGVALIVLGVIGLTVGGLSFTHAKPVADLGPIHVSEEKRDTLPVPPIAGGVCLVAGVLLLVVGGRGHA